jgi:hypothetical protein
VRTTVLVETNGIVTNFRRSLWECTTFGSRRFRDLAVAALLAGLTGCGSGVGNTNPPTDLIDCNCDGLPSSTPGQRCGEPNDMFSQAIEAAFDADGTACLQGTVKQKGDMDVFLIGAMNPGDRLIIDAETPDSGFDVAVAIFDAQQRLVYYNDDRGGATSRYLDAYIEWVVRHAGDSYYLVVSHSGFAYENQFAGSYVVDILVDGYHDIPEPAGQILLLDFDGARIDSPLLGPMTLAPFDAADIASVYQGQTETIKETIRATFEQNFERFDVTIWTTDDGPPPDGTPLSTVYFGGFNPDAFGIAEHVDLYNVDFCDDAVVFTESFSPRLFSVDPTAVEMGIAIGNIGSHEAGHLLGLNHVDDDRALMDDESVADAFLGDQEFMKAPLSSDIVPIGMQDAVLLLEETVGPALWDAFEAAKTIWGSKRRSPGGK